MQTPEDIFHCLIAVIKNLVQLFADVQGMRYPANPAPWQAIVHNIGHFHTTGNFPEMMLVMPESIGSHALFIHKILLVRHMRNFRHPEHGDAQQRPDGIGNDLAGIHGAASGKDPKTHIGWRDMLQIFRF